MRKILDACCGSRMFWFDKQNPDVEFVDNREFDDMQIWKSGDGRAVRYCSVHPTTLADFTELPFPDNTFYHVVFDPPHLLKVGDSSWLARKYGKLQNGWETMIHDGFWECMRVLKPNGTLIFKWAEVQIPLREILALTPEKPLFGHTSGKRNTTHWLTFMKEAA